MIFALYTLTRAGKIVYDALEDKNYVESSDFKFMIFSTLVSTFFVSIYVLAYDIWPKPKF